MMTFNLSWEVTICDLNFPTSYEIPVIVLNEFETISNITCYHAYMNSWKPIIGENLKTFPEHRQTFPEPESIIDKHIVTVLKDSQVVGHLTKGNQDDTPK